MHFRPKYPQLRNIVFLDRVGEALRWATSDIPKGELPDDSYYCAGLASGAEAANKDQDDGPSALEPSVGDGR